MKTNPRNSEVFFKLLAHREKSRARRVLRHKHFCRRNDAAISLSRHRAGGLVAAA